MNFLHLPSYYFFLLNDGLIEWHCNLHVFSWGSACNLGNKNRTVNYIHIYTISSYPTTCIGQCLYIYWKNNKISSEIPILNINPTIHTQKHHHIWFLQIYSSRYYPFVSREDVKESKYRPHNWRQKWFSHYLFILFYFYILFIYHKLIFFIVQYLIINRYLKYIKSMNI